MVNINFKKGIKYLSIFLGLLGNNVISVKADDCLIFKNAMENINKEKYGNMGDCCSSPMVKCENINGISQIKRIKLNSISCPRDHNLEELISNFSNLQYLTEFEITGSSSCGVAQNFPLLKNLKVLIYKDNRSTLPIPENISEMTNLETLEYCGNNSSGEIPESFGNLKNLKILKLNNNKLTGYIPYTFVNLKNLIEIQLHYNTGLEGYIPNMPNLQICDGSWTKLCKIKGTECNLNLNKNCSKQDILASNLHNHNPNPNSISDDEIIIEEKKSFNPFKIVCIFGGIVFCIIVSFYLGICVFCCCPFCDLKSKRRDSVISDKSTESNNNNNNNNNNNQSDNNNTVENDSNVKVVFISSDSSDDTQSQNYILHM
eukprot:jgi/Orpsp1_1/1186635/evm.model.d7180000052139.1